MGDRSAEALKTRRKRIEKEKRRRQKVYERKRAGEEVGSDEDVDEEDEKIETADRDGLYDHGEDENYQLLHASALSLAEECPVTHSVEDSDSWSNASEVRDPGLEDEHDEDEIFEDSGYDPTILQPSDFQWTSRCRALGWNSSAPCETKAFITGRGGGGLYGEFEVYQLTTDPNCNGIGTYICYWDPRGEETPVFPFHEACFSILARSLGYENRRMVDKDWMYLVMEKNSKEGSNTLYLDFDVLEEPEFSWRSEPGFEVSSH